MSSLSGLSPSIDMVSSDLFKIAKQSLDSPHDRYNIGTYKEGSQHLLLKMLYEPDTSKHEIPYGGYIADVLNEKGITEIQTVGFRALHDKLAVFLESFPVTVVYPVCEKKRTVWVEPTTGESSFGRTVTYSKTRYKLISELLSIVEHFGAFNLCIHAVVLRADVYKSLDGYGKDRKKRATKLDTVPEELLEIIELWDADDIRDFLPFKAGERLTSAQISTALGLKKIPLWRAIKFLTITEVLLPVGKKGNGIIYEFTPREDK